MPDDLTRCFTIPGPPFGQQRPRFSSRPFPHAVQPKENENYGAKAVMSYRQLYAGAPLLTGALRLIITAWYPIPASAPRWKRGVMLNCTLTPTVKPDWDNIGKAVTDPLEGITFRNDAQFSDARVSAFYSDEPRVEVVIREIGPSANCTKTEYTNWLNTHRRTKDEMLCL